MWELIIPLPGRCCEWHSVLQALEHVPVADEPTHWPTYGELAEQLSYRILSQVKLFVGFVERPVSQELVK